MLDMMLLTAKHWWQQALVCSLSEMDCLGNGPRAFLSWRLVEGLASQAGSWNKQSLRGWWTWKGRMGEVFCLPTTWLCRIGRGREGMLMGRPLLAY